MTTVSVETESNVIKPVAIIKAEKVNEFEFVKENSNYAINSNKHTYSKRIIELLSNLV